MQHEDNDVMRINDAKAHINAKRDDVTNTFFMYRIDVSHNKIVSNNVTIKIREGTHRIQFRCKKDISCIFLIRKNCVNSSEISCNTLNKKFNVKANIQDIIKSNIILEIEKIEIKLKFIDTVTLDCFFNGTVFKQSDFIKEIIKNYQKKKTFFDKTLDYFYFLNNNWFLPNIKVFVCELNTNHIFEEKTYKTVSLYLKYIFSNRLSRNKLHKKILKKLTMIAGFKYNSRKSIKIIDPFIKYFNIEMDDFIIPENGFVSFNDFFTRKLKQGARQIGDRNGVIAPADCRITIFEGISDAKNLWIKGNRFKLHELLNKESVETSGSIFICRLAPQDYHRFHSPVNGKVKSISRIEGGYLSVHPHSVHTTNVLTDNTRVVIEMSTDYGDLYIVPIGATLVGSIKLWINVGDQINTMQELGCFEFGGSTVLLVFEKMIEVDKSIVRNSYMGIETLVRLGNLLGNKRKNELKIV